MSTWFKITKYSDGVTPVEVEKETPDFLIFKGRRHAKSSEYESYFADEIAAIDALIKRCTVRRDYHRNELVVAEDRLSKALKLREAKE